jgi:ubiquinone/menaquinone biosynthesis C-methylase UbiE
MGQKMPDSTSEGPRLLKWAIGQFAKPRGFFGRIVGIILANRGSNVRRNRWTVGLLALAPRDRVLEIGSGPGVALKACLKRLKEGAAVGVDHSDVMIAAARRRNARAVRQKRLKLVQGTIDTLPPDEPPFDKIFSINVIQFLADKRGFITACARHLSPNGVLATAFQPRGVKPTREDAIAMAKALAALKSAAGLKDVRTEILEMKPIPAICVLAKKVV